MSTRTKYTLDLTSTTDYTSPAGTIPYEYSSNMRAEAPTESFIRDNLDMLAQFMVNAYKETSHNYSIDNAKTDLENYLGGKDGPPFFSASRLIYVNSTLVSVCLIGIWKQRQAPMLHFILTAPEWQSKGFGKLAVQYSMAALAKIRLDEKAEWDRCWAILEEGNLQSVKICEGVGFRALSM